LESATLGRAKARVVVDALRVSAPLGDDELHFRARWADWMFHAVGGRAADRADILVAMANRIGADDLRLQAHHARWTTAFSRGQVTIARDDIEHGLALYDLGRHREHWSMYGAHDPGVCACATGACTLWQAGLDKRAGDLAKQGIRLGNQLGHPFSLAAAHFVGGFFAMMVGDVATADTNAQATIAVATEANMAWPAGVGHFMAGWVIARQGQLGRGADQMEAGFRKLQEMKQRIFLTFLGTLLANAKLEMGRTEDALNFLLPRVCEVWLNARDAGGPYHYSRAGRGARRSLNEGLSACRCHRIGR
jgi:predicted ATPase